MSWETRRAQRKAELLVLEQNQIRKFWRGEGSVVNEEKKLFKENLDGRIQ